jgi:DNA-binding CsgD family transcriptional regulator
MAYLLCGCKNSHVEQQLELAESVMEDYPDSALTLLQQIDGSILRGEHQARHALLLSQAYDKNYIDLTSDSLISIATSYYKSSGNKRYKLMAAYYNVVILMNRQEYDKAISVAFDVEKLAEELSDVGYLGQISHRIAQSYLLSFDLEGANEYFEKSLALMRQLNKPQWLGIVYINMSNLALFQKNFNLAIEYADSARTYMPDDPDIAEYEMLAQTGLENYQKADSIFDTCGNPSTQVRAYKLLAEYQLGRRYNINDSITSLLSNATHYDSIEIAYVGSSINQICGDYKRAWYYTDIVLQETSKVLKDLSTHSLYQIQLEHDKLQYVESERKLRNQRQYSIFIGIIAALVITFSIIYFRMLRRQHDEQIARTKEDVLLIASEYSEMQSNLKREISHQTQEVANLRSQIQLGHIAVQELFTSKYAWIEELGNIFLDATASKAEANRALKELKQRLDSVKTQQFTENVIDVINKYCGNILHRVESECPAISDSERTILALLCAKLSPRIISFILNIKTQSIYNAKSSIKRKLESANPELQREIRELLA